MPLIRRPATLPCLLLYLSLCVGGLLASGCTPSPTGPAPAARLPATPAQAATQPADAVLVLRGRLLAHDGAGFARLAVPPALHAQLDEAWHQGRSLWPLDELPLDARIPGMLAALQKPKAEQALMATFSQQFAGADRDIHQAVRTLAVFGGEYVRKEAAYSAEERAHIGLAVDALASWAIQAPLSDPVRARHFFTALCAAARRTGIEATTSRQALATLGMTQGLNRLSPFFSTLLAQLHKQYGLDVDGSLRGLQASVLEQTADRARLQLRYTLAGKPIRATTTAVRIDGHWYLADYVQRAQASLGQPAAAPGRTPGRR